MNLLKLSRTAGKLFMRLMGLSWRITYTRPWYGRLGRSRGRNVLFTFWHGRQLPLIYTHRNEEVAVLVSMNTDGEYVANVLRSMGFRTVRGSSSRGGGRALREMVGLLAKGVDGAITPDGPRGPAEKVKPGLVLMAKLGGRNLVPIGTSAWPALKFNSWDGFVLPLPFARVVVAEGRAITGPTGSGNMKSWVSMVERAVSASTRTADILADPRCRLQSFACRILGHAARIPAEGAMLLRPGDEARERRGFATSGNDGPVWLHGSSLGELKGILPFFEVLRSKGVPVHVTCFTPAGRRFMEKEGIPGGFAPLDVPAYVERFLERVKPRALVLAETEIWPNTLYLVLKRGVPCVLVNGRLSPGSLSAYRRFLPITGNILSAFRVVAARTREDAGRFRTLGVAEDVLMTSGDMKSLSDSGDPPSEWRRLLEGMRPLLVAGSTRRGEEMMVAKAALAAGLSPVLAPRHLERVPEVESILRKLDLTPVRWSDLESGDARKGFRSVVVDVHGILASLYGVGDVAFVGGTLVPAGGHNVLEPLMRGVPLVVGPHAWNFREQLEFMEANGVALTGKNSGEIEDAFRYFVNHPPEKRFVLECFRKLKDGLDSEVTEILSMAGILPP